MVLALLRCVKCDRLFVRDALRSLNSEQSDNMMSKAQRSIESCNRSCLAVSPLVEGRIC